MSVTTAARPSAAAIKPPSAGTDYLARVRESAAPLAAAGRADRQRTRIAAGDHRRAGRARPVPPAVAGLARRRRIAAGAVRPGDRGAGQDRRQHGVVRQPELRLLDDRGASRAGGGARDLRRTARHPRLGAGTGRGACRAGRLPGHRQAGPSPAAAITRPGSAATCRSIEADGKPLLNADGTAGRAHDAVPEERTKFTDIWHTIGLRGTGSDQYSIKDLFVPEDYSVDVLSRRDLPAREAACSTGSAA